MAERAIRGVTVEGEQQVLIPQNRAVRGEDGQVEQVSAGGRLVTKAQAQQMAQRATEQAAKLTAAKEALESDVANCQSPEAKRLLSGVAAMQAKRAERLTEQAAALVSAAK